MDIAIRATGRIEAGIELPVSKSVSARALVLNALSGRTGRIMGLAQCDDTRVLQQALLRPDAGSIDVGMAGTAMRFLTAVCALRWGRVRLDGNERMRQRPIGPLVDALRQLGAHIDYAGSEGFPPLLIEGRPLHGGKVSVRGDVSSQFISALLMIGPAVGGLEVEMSGGITSRPYIEMTLGLMHQWGIESQWEGNVISVPAGHYTAPPLTVIEADWSASAPWWALQALLPESRIRLQGLRPESLQGDSRIVAIMEGMGVQGTWQGPELVLSNNGGCNCCCSTYADLNDTPDLAPQLIVMLCLLGRPYRLTGLRTLRMKETDRLEALRQELRKLGYQINIEGDDAVSWHFERCEGMERPVISPHGDHRMAMAFAPAAVAWPGLIIEDAEVVSKSYPEFWQHLREANFKIERI